MTKDQIWEEIEQMAAQDKPVKFNMDDLKFAFGFTRMSGEELSLRKLVSDNSEEQLQTAPPTEIHSNIEAWCREKGINFYYDHNEDYYIFKLPFSFI